VALNGLANLQEMEAEGPCVHVPLKTNLSTHAIFVMRSDERTCTLYASHHTRSQSRHLMITASAGIEFNQIESEFPPGFTVYASSYPGR
jgi:hypothetical protein